jgi:hypothetical protein
MISGEEWWECQHCRPSNPQRYKVTSGTAAPSAHLQKKHLICEAQDAKMNRLCKALEGIAAAERRLEERKIAEAEARKVKEAEAHKEKEAEVRKEKEAGLQTGMGGSKITAVPDNQRWTIPAFTPEPTPVPTLEVDTFDAAPLPPLENVPPPAAPATDGPAQSSPAKVSQTPKRARESEANSIATSPDKISRTSGFIEDAFAVVKKEYMGIFNSSQRNIIWKFLEDPYKARVFLALPEQDRMGWLLTGIEDYNMEKEDRKLERQAKRLKMQELLREQNL